MGQFALGQSVPRTEDPRLLTGRGRYTDDFTLPHQAYGYVLRSPHAHARIKSIDVRAAQQMPGVLAVLTGADWATEKFGAMLPVMPRKRRDGTPMYLPQRPSLAQDRAMLVGDPIAFVVADTVNLAKDAAERVEVEYETLPALTDTGSASTPNAPKLWSDCANNECFFYTLGDKAAVDAAFARAHHVTKLRMVFNRITAATMEPRGCIADYDERLERTTIYVGTQRPHLTRADLAAKVFHKPETQFRIVAGDVGGSFGMKGSHFPEYQLAAWASQKLRRPVKWISERSEGILSDDHDRDHIAEGELALDKDGKFLAMRIKQVSNI